jgi:hypothetical protein
VSLALVVACTLTTVTKVALLLFTIYSIQTIKQSIFYSNDNHRHVCMYACMQMTFQFHTLYECVKKVVKMEQEAFESKCDVRKDFDK